MVLEAPTLSSHAIRRSSTVLYAEVSTITNVRCASMGMPCKPSGASSTGQLNKHASTTLVLLVSISLKVGMVLLTVHRAPPRTATSVGGSNSKVLLRSFVLDAKVGLFLTRTRLNARIYSLTMQRKEKMWRRLRQNGKCSRKWTF